MWQNTHNRQGSTHWPKGFFLALVCGWAWFMASGTLRADPVDDLQQALKVPLSESGKPSDAFLKSREAQLKERVAALKTLGKWTDDPAWR